MAIQKKDVEHVARLARLELTEQEKDTLTVQLEKIIEYIEKLKEVDTTDIPPTAHPFGNPGKTVWRKDAVLACDNPEAIMKNSPEREENFFKVKKVIE